MEYHDEIFTYGVLEGEVKDERFKVVEGIIYFHDLILLNKDSKLKERLLNAAYEILLCKPTDFVKAYHNILGGFIWEGFEEEMHSHMGKCMDYLLEEGHLY